MRVVFMGTPAFAAVILEELASAHEVAAVYTRPDAVRGRGRALAPSPVKELAGRLGLEVRTPRTLRDEQAQRELAALAPEAICVAAYGAILPPAVLDIAPCLNVHASILPRWRGAAPIQHAILAGDAEAGVCIMRMEEGLDTGDYCIVRRVDAAGKDAAQLTDELADLGARALLSALDQLSRGIVRWMPQDDAQATYAHKIEKGQLDLDPAAAAAANVRRALASDDAHPARCVVAGKRVRVVRACLAQEGVLPGEGAVSFADKRLLLGCAEGAFEVLELKPEGKRQMGAVDFAAGNPAVRAGQAVWSA